MQNGTVQPIVRLNSKLLSCVYEEVHWVGESTTKKPKTRADLKEKKLKNKSAGGMAQSPLLIQAPI